MQCLAGCPGRGGLGCRREMPGAVSIGRTCKRGQGGDRLRRKKGTGPDRLRKMSIVSMGRKEHH